MMDIKSLKNQVDLFLRRHWGTTLEEFANSAGLADKWILTSERLPSEQEDVIVTIYDDRGDTPWEYTTNAWHIDGVWIADNAVVCGNILAWKPLPEPYKGETNGKM